MTRWTCACPARSARRIARRAWTWPGTSPRWPTGPTACRLRPRSHYALGWLPRWSRRAGAAPRLVNALLRIRPLATAVLAAGGMDTRRAIPSSARVPFRRSNGRVALQRQRPGRAAPGGAVGRLLQRRHQCELPVGSEKTVRRQLRRTKYKNTAKRSGSIQPPLWDRFWNVHSLQQ